MSVNLAYSESQSLLLYCKMQNNGHVLPWHSDPQVTSGALVLCTSKTCAFLVLPENPLMFPMQARLTHHYSFILATPPPGMPPVASISMWVLTTVAHAGLFHSVVL
jgi:hypothetical protein